MNAKLRKWLLSAALAGSVAVGGSMAVPVLAQDPPPGTRADLREDRHDEHELGERIGRDREQLERDSRAFGSHSPEARADRAQLRADQKAMKRLHHDMKRDRHIRHERDEHEEHHEGYREGYYRR